VTLEADGPIETLVSPEGVGAVILEADGPIKTLVSPEGGGPIETLVFLKPSNCSCKQK
jgi:hypothetical protein